MQVFSEQYDVVVIGAGHAGCEVEAISGRELKREPAAEILSEAKHPAEQDLP